MIFYERGVWSNNNGLIEIKDEEFLSQLKADFGFNYRKFNSYSPQICGTIVNHGLGQPVFDRKLKMVRAPIYSLL
jgi:hypothetical protein